MVAGDGPSRVCEPAGERLSTINYCADAGSGAGQVLHRGVAFAGPGYRGDMGLSLVEEFLLLAYNPGGRPMIDGQKLDAALAGMALVELTMAGSLELSGPRLVATGRAPVDRRLGALAGVADGRKPKDAVARIAGFTAFRGRSRGLREAFLNGLVSIGALQVSRDRVLGVFPTTRWTPGDPAVEAAILGRIRAAVLDGSAPDERTAALISILHAVDLLPRLFADADRRAVRRRGKEISDSDWGAAAVRKAVQEVQAVMVAVLVTTAAGAAVSAG
jgi:hypothetical protein